MGPLAGYEHILQPDNTLRPDDAHIFLLGAHFMLGAIAPHPAVAAVDAIATATESSIRATNVPIQPEDKDGFEDQDGCPDPDNDKDEILDVEDACPNEPGVRTADAKTNGCPCTIATRTASSTIKDKCPDEPEDKDGFEDEDGCPDPDNDKDGILDAVDQVPERARNRQRLRRRRRLPRRRTGARRRRSHPARRAYPFRHRQIDRIARQPAAALARDAAHQKAPRVCSHRGRGLRRRARRSVVSTRSSPKRGRRSVRDLLVRWGIARDRVSFIGFGTSNPRASNKSYKAYRENRRVEFKITRQTKTWFTPTRIRLRPRLPRKVQPMRPCRARDALRRGWAPVAVLALSALACGKDALVGGSCRQGLTECSLECVDLAQDPGQLRRVRARCAARVKLVRPRRAAAPTRRSTSAPMDPRPMRPRATSAARMPLARMHLARMQLTRMQLARMHLPVILAPMSPRT